MQTKGKQCPESQYWGAHTLHTHASTPRLGSQGSSIEVRGVRVLSHCVCVIETRWRPPGPPHAGSKEVTEDPTLTIDKAAATPPLSKHSLMRRLLSSTSMSPQPFRCIGLCIPCWDVISHCKPLLKRNSKPAYKKHSGADCVI